ncbi:MAG: hypothetical protein QG656_2782 [Candidatus Hydrogenedentes bacterium]|nr:hypothetical protein [Candidatus Hydrogenedentota bacterium]
MPTPFPVGPANAFLLVTDPPILIDTGPQSDEAYDILVGELDQHGVQLRDIGHILITHGHLDHIGLLARILAEAGAEAYAHPYAVAQWEAYDNDATETARFYCQVLAEFGIPKETVERITLGREAFRSFGAAVTIQHPLDDGECVGPLRTVYVPGHSPSDVVYFDECRKIAFSGDHLLKSINPNPLLRRPLPGQPRAKSLLEYQASIRRTRTLDIETCYPGHGKPFGDPNAIIDRILARHEQRNRQILDMLSDELITPYELACQLFPGLDIRMLHLGLSVAVGHLEALEERGQVAPVWRDGLCYYHLTPTEK